MDFSAYREFPFPSKLTEAEEQVKRFFLTLTDGEQLGLLNGCQSYEEFRSRVAERMNT